MNRITIDSVRGWLQRNRTSAEYAFGATDIALGLNADVMTVFYTCCTAVNAGMLAFVQTDPDPVYYFTLPTVGTTPPKAIHELLATKRVVKNGDQYMWTSRKASV